ncbi:hypothetical protein AAFF_G00431370 [Aldrovandia affinis]|uniref:SIS domain-containing protein n=1 Tax=Aldrovandia affinis TaxID=143900 RepID=A0AAD7S8S2_9TELE|nr:hypothetical protein AAFF_G00431370 [Aldrovandia affinis]
MAQLGVIFRYQGKQFQVAACEPALPVTEKSNPRTRDIDRALPAQMVQLLQDCDAEIFQHQWKGESSCPGIYSDSVVQTLVHVAKKVEDILKDPEDSVIVMSGCGTSGRLAYLLVTFFNKLLKGLQRPQIFTYIIAGGDKAILTSQEAPEDCPQLGVRRMEELDFCMNNLHIFTPVLIGFNPVNMAR